MLHVAGFLMVGIVGCQPSSYLAQGYYCVAAVSLTVVWSKHIVFKWGTRVKSIESICASKICHIPRNSVTKFNLFT